MYFNMESFGADLPTNWEEIASWLNALLDERVSEDMDEHDIREAAEQLWEDFWGGRLEAAPMAMEGDAE